MVSADLAKGRELSDNDVRQFLELQVNKLLSFPCSSTLPKTTDTKATYIPTLHIMSSPIHIASSSGTTIQAHPIAPPTNLLGAAPPTTVGQVPQRPPQNLSNRVITREEADLQPWRQ